MGNRDFCNCTVHWRSRGGISDSPSYRLPSDLTGSILVHDATQAWFRLHPDFDFEIPTPPFVEELLCQLVAYLFLSEGLPTPSKVSTDGGPSEERLR